MEQGEARRKAKELGGLAMEARLSPDRNRWLLGGWPGHKDATWIVISLDRSAVLADGRYN